MVGSLRAPSVLIKTPLLLGIDIQNDVSTFLKVKKFPKLLAGEGRGGGHNLGNAQKESLGDTL